MKAKSIVLKGANVEAAQADREILGRYLSNYELLEFPKDEKSYSLANDEDFFDMEVTLFGVHYRLEVFPYEMRTDDYQSAINGKVVEGGIGPCRTFRGNVKDTNQVVRLTITEEGMSGFIQLEGQKLFVRKAVKFNLRNAKPSLFVVYYERDMVDTGDSYCGVTDEEERRFLDTLPQPPRIVPSSSSECRILKIATDADFAYFQLYGSATNANDVILDVINLIEEVYIDTFGLAMRVTFQNVWTSNDPYTGDPADSVGSEVLVEELRNYWQANFTGVSRDVVHLFTGVNAFIGGVAGRVYDIGTICATPADSYGFTRERFNSFLTTAHEIGHNFGGIHSDGQDCDTPNASIMCQGEKRIPMYFSAASITRMSNFINAHSACLDPALVYRILGDSLICTSEVYTISHLLPTVTTVWSVSPSGAATISGGGNTRTVTRSPLYNGLLTLNVTVTTNCGTIHLSRLLYAGAPANMSVDGMSSAVPYQTNIFLVEGIIPHMEISSYDWFVIPDPSTGAGGGDITPTSPGVAEIWFDTSGTYDVGVIVTNSCGWVEATKLTVYVM